MNYDSFMDQECIELCDALNSIPGVETVESCCGHGTSSFKIWFKTSEVSQLFAIGRITSRNYTSYPNWKCEVSIVDSDQQNPIRFFIHSGGIMGEEAYKQAVVLAKEIHGYLTDNKWISKEFGVKRL